MHTKFFNVLQELATLSEELNVMTPIEDCESTAEFFGTKVDCHLKGKWLCVCLPIDDAVRIAKSNICLLLPYELDDESILLCTRMSEDSKIICNK